MKLIEERYIRVPREAIIKGINDTNYLLAYIYLILNKNMVNKTTVCKASYLQFTKVKSRDAEIARLNGLYDVLEDVHKDFKVMRKIKKDKTVIFNTPQKMLDFKNGYAIIYDCELDLYIYNAKKINLNILLFLSYYRLSSQKAIEGRGIEIQPQYFYCYLSNLAEILHLNVRTLSKLIKQLEDDKVIMVKKIDTRVLGESYFLKGFTLITDYNSRDKTHTAEEHLKYGTKCLKKKMEIKYGLRKKGEV